MPLIEKQINSAEGEKKKFGKRFEKLTGPHKILPKGRDNR